MKRLLAAVILVSAMLSTHAAWAQTKAATASEMTDMAALRAAVVADKKALVATTLNLTPDEAKKFWPIYDTYQRSLDLANRRRTVALVGLVGKDQPLSDLYAKNLANELMAADETEVKARRTLNNRLLSRVPMRKVLPAAKAVRYLQLEAKIRAAQAYDIAATIPLSK